GHHVLRPIRIVLQEWNRPDRIHTRRERDDHRPPVAAAAQPRAHLVPAGHRTARRNPRVVGMPEPDLAAGPAADALGDRWAAVLLERGRVEHAIADRLALLALKNTLADFLGVKLQANIRLADSAPCSRAAERAHGRRSRPVRGPTIRPRTAKPSPSPWIETAPNLSAPRKAR